MRKAEEERKKYQEQEDYINSRVKHGDHYYDKNDQNISILDRIEEGE